ncbi:hypothetical protein KIN20_027663 [Parelaphostrongylus tenuis]|uniref:Uncharacterized protein n=1 Tax=Parelaphostrongylus tenuis TaxID=148309 RepID=A0AAD5R001_PARTN|nr:hypothetical protein KIN20_027663 [Parelaphostrongylus tenuis]
MGGIMYKNNNMAGAMYISTTKGTRNHLEISESASRYTVSSYKSWVILIMIRVASRHNHGMRLALAAMVELNQQLGWRPREKKRMENVLVYIDLVKSKRQRIQLAIRFELFVWKLMLDRHVFEVRRQPLRNLRSGFFHLPVKRSEDFVRNTFWYMTFLLHRGDDSISFLTCG